MADTPRDMLMFTCHRLLSTVMIALLLPGFAAAQDRDAKEVQSHVLTDTGLAKYTQATKTIAALPGGACDDGDSKSIDQMTAKLNASPGVKAAIQSAGMTTREYVVFTWSLLQTGLAAWAVDQPGGKLPPGTSKANVDFFKKHEADLKQLEGLKQDNDCDEDRESDE
ncbi:MAG: hypothetical protein OEX13_13560 [Gammaproteobacteria bacterium]|nr:hypothetical protein [Gammaproteobacteria bacterium]